MSYLKKNKTKVVDAVHAAIEGWPAIKKGQTRAVAESAVAAVIEELEKVSTITITTTKPYYSPDEVLRMQAAINRDRMRSYPGPHL
ncbi:hypothetical protein [Mycobacterium intracellulare]|uniref:Uncharacterized protein n=1 Tax=Mycobacterium intracellulare TaxID=1767 RepID=A0AAE4RCN3_MYCIT|nr:hypothetical protein [Mycobacterium intracellulare]MDV6975269.1 hypothetical protein [Mycobacterium intracellulare]MDV6980333.1 hypothetical protein [Mycobacterium intracellulare]MDV7010762.1 hypothetical protein [Mycobacterium intracellulare]MDV7025668.1 hypothetical protein [Mycobacterium intracellulare]